MTLRFRIFLAAVLMTGTTSVAHAQGDDFGANGSEPDDFENAPKHYRSAQHFAFELKFGPYSPNIDSSPGLGRDKPQSHPFAELFDKQGSTARPPGRLLSQIEFDWEFFHKFGTLAVGHTIGLQRRDTYSFVYTNDYTAVPCIATAKLCTRSGDNTTLSILPLSIMIVYRFDLLANRYHVPLVPYFKTGPAYYIWWSENGGGPFSISKSLDGKSGYGGTFGWVFHPGLALILDYFEPSVSKGLDSEIGINHTYLFAEMHYANITGFGASDKLVLSDLTWSGGLGFEF